VSQRLFVYNTYCQT